MTSCLFGEYEHTMDNKGRVSLPAAFRKQLPDEVILAPGQNGQINVFSPDGFMEWKKSLFEADGGFNTTNQRHVMMRQFFNSHATKVDIDSAGRISVSPKLREYANLQKTVYITGDEDHACLWNKDVWDEYIGNFKLEDIWTAF